MGGLAGKPFIWYDAAHGWSKIYKAVDRECARVCGWLVVGVAVGVFFVGGGFYGFQCFPGLCGVAGGFVAGGVLSASGVSRGADECAGVVFSGGRWVFFMSLPE